MSRSKGPRTTIAALPHEILISIVAAGRHLRRRKGTPLFPVLASHVCRTWRDIVLNTPSLWTWVDLTTNGKKDLYAALEERSKTNLLEVTMTVDTCHTHIPSRKIAIVGIRLDSAVYHMDFFARIASRCRSLHVSVGDLYAAMTVVFPRLKPLHAPNLRYFGVSVAGEGALALGPNEDAIPLFKGGAPLLAQLRITAPALRMLPMDNLTALIIHRAEEERPFTYQQLRTMVLASPALTSLILEGSVLDRFAREDRAPISLPHLRELQIELEPKSELEGHAYLLDLLDTPGVRTLVLLNALYATSLRSLFNCVVGKANATASAAAYPELRALTLFHGEYFPGCVTDLAQAFPGLAHLKLMAFNPRGFLRQLVEPLPAEVSDWLPWPQLRSLSLEFFGERAMRDFVEERRAMGCPIRELRTQGFGALRSAADLKWYAEQGVEIVHINADAEERARTHPYHKEEFEVEAMRYHI